MSTECLPLHLAQAEGLRRWVGVNGTRSSETTLVRQRNGNGIIIALLQCCRRGGHGIQRPRLALPIREIRDALEDFGQLHSAVSTTTSPDSLRDTSQTSSSESPGRVGYPPRWTIPAAIAAPEQSRSPQCHPCSPSCSEGCAACTE